MFWSLEPVKYTGQFIECELSSLLNKTKVNYIFFLLLSLLHRMIVLLFIPVFYCLLIRVLVIVISSSASIVFARANIPNFSVAGRAICFIQSCKSGGKVSGYIHTYLCQTHGLFDIDLI
jgi:hypothetical protein